VISWKYLANRDSEFGRIEENVYQAILHSLHDYMQNHSYDDSLKEEVMKWEQGTQSVYTTLAFRSTEYGECKMDLCSLLGWESTFDIAGRGVCWRSFAERVS
jgi:hypothetical protein